MKGIKTIISLTLVALIIQQGIFLYIEKFYLTSNKDIVIKRVEENEECIGEIESTITLDSNVGDVQVSDSGRFVSYIKNGKITVLNCKDNTEKQIDCSDEIVFCKWKEKEDSLIIFKKVKSGKNESFILMPYDAKRNEVKELTNFERQKSQIIINDTNDKIDKVAYSILSATMYVKVLKSNGRSDLYYINIENTIEKVRSNIVLDNIVVPSNANKCVMEVNGNATILDNKDNIKIPNALKVKVLGSDINNNVYLGEVSNNRISKVYYKNVNDENTEWTTLPLSKESDYNNIAVDINGGIIVNDNNEKNVTELVSGQVVKYEGEFVQAIKGGFISRKENVLTKHNFTSK